ncbi:hypothetical protein [Nonomuraea sp. NPDC002799]
MTMLRLVRAMAASILLLAMVVGFPILFYKIAGFPFSDHLPSLQQLADTLRVPDDGTLFVKALELVAWGAWATFSFTVVCEVIAKVRGRRLAPRLPGLRGMQRIAAYLVASATLAVLAPGVSNAVTPPPVVAMAPMHPLGQPAIADVDVLPEERIYQVRQGDSLWRIAATELGSPRRWPKIWKLNARSRQPDGHTFTEPGLIHVGWKLRLPLKYSKPSHTPSTTERPLAPETSQAPVPSTSPRPQPSNAQHPTKREATEAIRLSSGSLVALAYAAGISTAYIAGRLHRRRRRLPPAASEAVTITPEPQLAEPVRELHRVHRQAFAERDEPMPSDGELMQQDYSIDVPEQIQLGQSSDNSPLWMTLEGPGIGFTGPGAYDVVRYLTVEMLRQSSNYRIQVIVSASLAEPLFGLPADDLHRVGEGLFGLVLTTSHEDALLRFEEVCFMRRRMILERGNLDIGELRRSDPGEGLPAVVLIAELDDKIHEHVRVPITSALGAGVGAVISGSWPWGITCEIGSTHLVETAEGRGADSLAGGQLFHITVEEAEAHLRQLASVQPDVDEEPAPPSSDVHSGWPGPTLVRLTIIGHPTVHVRDRAESLPLSWLQLNMLTYLALHPNGVTRDQLATALWPDDLGKDIHNALRHLRGALVTATKHQSVEAKRAPFISASTTKDSATYRIDPNLISVDLWDYEAALEELRIAVEREDRLAALSKAARLCTGELAEGLTAEWIEDQRYPLIRSQADVLAQLAELLADEDIEQALSALERARRLDPDTEETYFQIIRLQLRLDRRDEASRTAQLLRQHQSGLGLSTDYQTEKRLGEIFYN